MLLIPGFSYDPEPIGKFLVRVHNTTNQNFNARTIYILVNFLPKMGENPPFLVFSKMKNNM